ncbi:MULTISPECIES: DNA polymerase IV [unclassified Nitratiruptor]|uniref:DNA polymerase Y family protein n=1 Tax=unclassified Nitratiruptor TaxID=2624044 RepID=UPI0019157EBC|nr:MULTISPECIES: DNA polymerase IV [unclassified Nitratiruptor]BCD59547.1 DNA polymerase IV [Nitratiruptor sp. YY08-10]BCD63471.1 DNA polymerase IV [Nitratiruptor sp. YY08-14]
MKIHIDIDAFFISAERVKNPSLRDIPAAVGGRGDPFIFDPRYQHKMDLLQKHQGAFVPSIFYDADMEFDEYFKEGEKIRGIIITSSYEARRYGVKTGISVKEALQLCPHLKVVPPNHLYYHKLSNALHNLLQKEIPVVEQFSIDEFFGDLDGYIDDEYTETFIRHLQILIKDKLGLPVSIGAAKSKWTAKLATSYAKPNGVRVVWNVDDFIKNIPVEKFPGIGRGYLKRLRRYGIQTLGETKNIKDIFYSWKLPGITLYKRIWGEDNEPLYPKRPRKSVGISRTIDPISDRKEVQRRVIVLARHLSDSVAKEHLNPTQFVLSIKYDTGYKSKAHCIHESSFSEAKCKQIALELFHKADIYPTASVVRIALRCLRFKTYGYYELFNWEKEKKFTKLLQQSQKVRQKYGMDLIKWGVELM